MAQPLAPDPPRFRAEVVPAAAGGWTVELARAELTRRYHLPEPTQNACLDAFSEIARDFGARVPASRQVHAAAPTDPALKPLLTRSIDPAILYGYGDPCVVRVFDPATGAPSWRLLCTSNDAPDAFPMLASDDLVHWRLQGFVLPRDHAPSWALVGRDKADFWAPELHRAEREWRVCFAARRRDRELAVGLARGPSPDGPFVPDPEPLLGGGVIDPHILTDRGGRTLVFWKEDSNDHWPRRLAGLLHADETLCAALFPAEADRLTASVAAALWPWIEHLEPMQQFFLLQPLIEAATEDFPAFTARVEALGARRPALSRALSSALKTRVYAQALSADGRRLEGPRQLVLENDQPWEAHLIEGVWITEHAGRWWLFYAGNDFSTHAYGVGAAVASDPLGPYQKTGPLLRSSSEWVGPGHPSVAPGPDGEPWLFVHAFLPGAVGYKAFRAVLAAKLAFGPDGPGLVDTDWPPR
jgi:hypothetical protein